MALVDRMPAADALAHEITTMDRMASGKPGYNRHALGIMLGAVAEIREEVAGGADIVTAFMRHFCPTRGLHGVAKRMRFPLDVSRGQWVRR